MHGSQDHRAEADEPQASPGSDSASPYEDFLVDLPAPAPRPTAPTRSSSSSSGSKTTTQLEAMMSSGLGSIAMFGQAHLQQVEQAAQQEEAANATRRTGEAGGEG